MMDLSKEIEDIKEKIEHGGPETSRVSSDLEAILRRLKIFDQKRFRKEQLESDIDLRMEAVVMALSEILKKMESSG